MSSQDMYNFIQRDRANSEEGNRIGNEYNYSTRPFSGALPYSTTPKIRNSERMDVGLMTLYKGQMIDFNDKLAREAPFYERQINSLQEQLNEIEETLEIERGKVRGME